MAQIVLGFGVALIGSCPERNDVVRVGFRATVEGSHKEAYDEEPSHHRVLAHVGQLGQDIALIVFGSWCATSGLTSTV